MTKQQTIETLKTQLPGFYSAEQVIEMINKIEDSGSTPFDVNEFKEQIEEAIRRAVDNMSGYEVVDFDSVEFTINGREIEVEGIDVNEGDIATNVMDAIEGVFEKFFGDNEDNCGC